MPRFVRKIIRITAEDSPNVRLGLQQRAAGMTPTGETLLPGVLPWADYVRRTETWDEVMKCVGLRAQFYEGASVLLYPPTWLNRAEELAERIRGRPRRGRAVGIDPAEGGDKTSMSVVDEYGLIEQLSKKTPDTSMITGEAIAFGRKWGVPPEEWVFDRGGGGKEHADRLRAQGFPVRTVSFGAAPTPPPRRSMTPFAERVDAYEDRTTYRNCRAEMYGTLRELLDPGRAQISEVWRAIAGLAGRAPADFVEGFAIPREYIELRRQLAPMPLLYDQEGVMYMLSKHRKDDKSKEKTLVDLLGCSPDEADSLVIAVYGMVHKARRPTAGVR
jgi:hypothetical protein